MDSELLSLLVEAALAKEKSAATLFRGNTLASKAVDQYMKMVAMPFLHAALSNPVRALFDEKRACELDPTRKGRPDNAKVLLEHADRILCEVYAKAPLLATELRVVLARAQAAAGSKFPKDGGVRYLVVSAFLLLRLIVPAIMNPKLFNMMPSHPSAETARSLTLVAKVVMNVANFVEFGAKEPFMAVCNGFVAQHIPRMKQFLDTAAVRGGGWA
jgi:Ras GTPase-activating protein 1